jgi:hypothetical protein
MTANLLKTVSLTLFVLLVSGCASQQGQQLGPSGAAPDEQEASIVVAGGRPCDLSQASNRNCFIIELAPPPVGSRQPLTAVGAVGRGGRLPEATERSPSTAGEWQVIMIAPDTSYPEHPDTHEHDDGGQSGTGHCHYWYRLSDGTNIQIHC